MPLVPVEVTATAAAAAAARAAEAQRDTDRPQDVADFRADGVQAKPDGLQHATAAPADATRPATTDGAPTTRFDAAADFTAASGFATTTGLTTAAAVGAGTNIDQRFHGTAAPFAAAIAAPELAGPSTTATAANRAATAAGLSGTAGLTPAARFDAATDLGPAGATDGAAAARAHHGTAGNGGDAEGGNRHEGFDSRTGKGHP